MPPNNKGKKYATVPLDVKITAFSFMLEHRDKFGWGPSGSNDQNVKDCWHGKLVDKLKEDHALDLEWKKVNEWFNANKASAQKKNLNNSLSGRAPQKLTRLEVIVDQVCSLSDVWVVAYGLS